MALRTIVLTSFGTVALAVVPKCSEMNVAYKEGSISQRNGGHPMDALGCQMFCVSEPNCQHFTYYNKSKECWLLGSSALPVPTTGAVSGPKDCSLAFAIAATNALRNPPPPTEVPPSVPEAASSADEGSSTDIAAKATSATDEPELAAANSETAGSFPMWGYALCGLGVAGLAGGAAYAYSAYSPGGNKKEKKNKTRAMKRGTEAEMTSAGQASLRNEMTGLLQPQGQLQSPELLAPQIASTPMPQYGQFSGLQGPVVPVAQAQYAYSGQYPVTASPPVVSYAPSYAPQVYSPQPQGFVQPQQPQYFLQG
eukprot:TRINITY_DN41643_c0_g1_i1.p1 TRINITY_DN41643_c0_g1~~TRINITY_DN41643_c0_g1_i1.p1  ORF type:complete len:310 (+),score=60.58 TRINITY_DN41643_c0_g1_i1:83-1012(+)